MSISDAPVTRLKAPTLLVEYAPELRATESNWPKIKFHALREHAGLVFQRRLEG